MQIAVLFAALGRFEASVTKAAELTFENSPPLPPELIHHGAAHQQLVLLLPSERYSVRRRLITTCGFAMPLAIVQQHEYPDDPQKPDKRRKSMSAQTSSTFEI